MTLEKLKTRILELLGILEASSESALCAAIDSVGKKVALYAKNIKKSTALVFTQENGRMLASLPADFAAFGYIGGGRNMLGREQVEIVSGKIRTSRIGAGTYELVYFAYPPEVNTETSGETELGFDDYAAYTVAYGAAMELCPLDDATRYRRLSTEFDARFAELLTAARDAGSVANTFFSARRMM